MTNPIWTIAAAAATVLVVAPATLQGRQVTKPPAAEMAQDQRLDTYYQVDKALDLVGLKPGMTVGQIGTEHDYLLLKLAASVGPTGGVFASGTDEAMLKRARDRAAGAKLAPVEPVVERYVEDASFGPGSLDMVFVFDSWKFLRQRLIASGAALKPGGRLVFIAMEEGERAVDLSGSPVTSFIPNRRSARNILSASGYAIETVDDTAMPHHTVFIVTPKPRPPAAPRTADDILKELRSAQAYEPERNRREQTDTSLDAIGLTRGMRVAEVGAGSGYLVEKLVRRVGPEGKVYAEDIGAEPLDVLRLRMAEGHLPNVEVILGKATDPRLPAKTLDMVVISTTMHFVDAPVELFRNIAPSLKPGGKLVLIEWERGQVMSPDGEKATQAMYRTRAQFLEVFEKSGFKVDRIDTTTTPYRTIFILSPARAEGR